jgi:hypothetical protein
LTIKDGWRRAEGKPQRFLQLCLKNAVDAVDSQAGGVNSVNTVNSDSEEDHPDEKIVRVPDGTPPLSSGDEWEEI